MYIKLSSEQKDLGYPSQEILSLFFVILTVKLVETVLIVDKMTMENIA